jgi:ribonuclease P protein component
MREADISAQQPQAEEDPRVPPPDEDPRRSSDPEGPPSPGSRPPVGLIWRVRGRAAFGALARRPRHRRGVVTVSYLAPPSDAESEVAPPRVAYAVGRRVGGAVARNRVRRRLRVAVREVRSRLRPGASYLVGALPGAPERSATEVGADLAAAVAAAHREAA